MTSRWRLPTITPIITGFKKIRIRLGFLKCLSENFHLIDHTWWWQALNRHCHYLINIKFNDKQISYLKSLQTFKEVGEDFFAYLKQFKFTGTVWAVPEGTVLFPNEPIIRIEAPIIEAQIVETYLLSTINFQTLIATKASRIVTSAGGKAVIEFGSRRAHGPQAGLLAD